MFNQTTMIPCHVCRGSGFSGLGTGYGDVCSECGGLKEFPAPPPTTVGRRWVIRSEEQRRWHTCMRKQAFAKITDAYAAARGSGIPRMERYAYQCRYCSKWHITRKRTESSG